MDSELEILNIRHATISDAQDVCDIANSNTLSDLSDEQREDGFLVSKFSVSDYEKYINTNKYFFVLEEKGEIKAFLLAYDVYELDDSLIVNQFIKQHAKNPFVVIKQICVKRNSFKKGFAKQLYNYFLGLTNSDIYLAVVLEPLNKSSIYFHKKMGFKQAFIVKPEDGMKRLIYYKQNHFNEKVVYNQYNVAVDLYKHEDELNWSKMNHLFYVTGGLGALISIIVTSPILPMARFLLIVIISVFGIVASLLFKITISIGVDYMLKRKSTVFDLEKIIIKLNGTRVVYSAIDKYVKSPSSYIMKTLPMVVTLMWCLVFIACWIFYFLFYEYLQPL